jgi:transposase-like protein
MVCKIFIALIVVNSSNSPTNPKRQTHVLNDKYARCTTFNGNGIRDIQQVLGVSIVGIVMILRI